MRLPGGLDPGISSVGLCAPSPIARRFLSAMRAAKHSWGRRTRLRVDAALREAFRLEQSARVRALVDAIKVKYSATLREIEQACAVTPDKPVACDQRRAIDQRDSRPPH